MRYISTLFVVLLISGCGSQLPEISVAKERQLSIAISSMDKSVNRKEARKIAHEAIYFSRTLAKKYKVDTSPWFHNFLVNTGIKKRGLCYQWADDLMKHLSYMHPKSIRLLPIGANIGDYWREHNAIVVLPVHKNTPLSQGIILDAWRHSGDLYFTSVAKDLKYKWRIRSERLKVVKQ